MDSQTIKRIEAKVGSPFYIMNPDVYEENVKAFVGADFDNLVPSQVRNVRSLSADSAHAYTLSGQPATDSSKGIIICNGVKTRK